jgi:hypothetical protein
MAHTSTTPITDRQIALPRFRGQPEAASCTETKNRTCPSAYQRAGPAQHFKKFYRIILWQGHIYKDFVSTGAAFQNLREISFRSAGIRKSIPRS